MLSHHQNQATHLTLLPIGGAFRFDLRHFVLVLFLDGRDFGLDGVWENHRVDLVQPHEEPDQQRLQVTA